MPRRIIRFERGNDFFQKCPNKGCMNRWTQCRNNRPCNWIIKEALEGRAPPIEGLVKK